MAMSQSCNLNGVSVTFMLNHLQIQQDLMSYSFKFMG